VQLYFLGDGRYKLVNLGIKEGVRITSPGGKNIVVPPNGNDQVLIGDSIAIGNWTKVVQP